MGELHGCAKIQESVIDYVLSNEKARDQIVNICEPDSIESHTYVQCIPSETFLNCELKYLKYVKFPHRYIILKETNGFL